MLQEAGLRTHGTTRQQPLALFALEQPFLKPLRPQAPDLGVWTEVTPYGTRKGPPLVHPIYNPGHHGNQAIYNAVLR